MKTINNSDNHEPCEYYEEVQEIHYCNDYEKGYRAALGLPPDPYMETKGYCKGTREMDPCPYFGNRLACEKCNQKKIRVIKAKTEKEKDRDKLFNILYIYFKDTLYLKDDINKMVDYIVAEWEKE